MLTILFNQGSGVPAVVVFPPTVSQLSDLNYTQATLSDLAYLRDGLSDLGYTRTALSDLNYTVTALSDLGYLRNVDVDFVGRE